MTTLSDAAREVLAEERAFEAAAVEVVRLRAELVLGGGSREALAREEAALETLARARAATLGHGDVGLGFLVAVGGRVEWPAPARLAFLLEPTPREAAAETLRARARLSPEERGRLAILDCFPESAS